MLADTVGGQRRPVQGVGPSSVADADFGGSRCFCGLSAGQDCTKSVSKQLCTAIAAQSRGEVKSMQRVHLHLRLHHESISFAAESRAAQCASRTQQTGYFAEEKAALRGELARQV